MNNNYEKALDAFIDAAMSDPAAPVKIDLEPEVIQALCQELGVDSVQSLHEALQLAAAETMLATMPADANDAMPSDLKQRVLAQAAPFVQDDTSAAVDFAAYKTKQKKPAAFGWSAGLGWAAAAALFVALIWQPKPQLPTVQPTPTAAEVRLELMRDANSLTVAWGPSEIDTYTSVSGDVVWNNQQQRGFLRLVNMPANDPAQTQYQLWIVDPDRDANPIDGGVFDIVTAGAEVLIPIDAKLPVLSPKAFAITREQPGGVVVSEGPLLLVAAG